MKWSARRSSRGFTLIELMMSVAIVGLLSSVALPEFSRATLRARAAERGTIMKAIIRAVDDTVTQQQGVVGGAWVGAANPPGAPGNMKRKFDWTQPGWAQLPLFVEGDAYYSYSFDAEDPTGDGQNVTLVVTGDGDLDGDGVHSLRTDAFVGVGYSFSADPDPTHWIHEDLQTF